MRAASGAATSGVPVQPLPALAWYQRFELAKAMQSQLANWANPVEETQFQVGLLAALGEALGAWTGLYRVQRWGVQEHGRLAGAVEVKTDAFGEAHRLRLFVRPEAQGRVERALVSQGVRALADAPAAPILAEHSGDHAAGVAALEAAGFRPQRVLLTMRRQIVPADALL